MKIRYIERIQLDPFRQLHIEREIHAISVWTPPESSLAYVRRDRFNITTIAKNDILEVISNEENQ